MKKFKKVEDMNKKQLEKQLKPIKNGINNANKKPLRKLQFLKKLALKQKKYKIKELHKKTSNTKLVCMHTSGKIFDFNVLKML